MTRRGLPLGLGVLVAGLVLGCSAPTMPDRPGGAAPGPSASSAAPTTPPSQEPLVVAVHATRPAPRLTLTEARAVAAGEVGTWRTLDGTDRPLRLVASLGEVRRDRDAVAVLPASRIDASIRAARVDGVDPLRRPADYPLSVDGPAPPAVTTLTVVGDIMLGRRVGTRAAAAGDPGAPLRPLQGRLRSADLTVGNLESALSADGPPQQGGDSFAAPPAVVDGLSDAGFDALSLANNHTGDYGEQALLDTLDLLADGPVRAFGAGRDLAEAGRAYVAERNGVRFGFLAFNAIGETPRATRNRPGALSVRMPPRTGPLVERDLTRVERRVRRLDGEVDVVVVLPHWGTQYTHVAEPVQAQVARRLVDAGADLVAGGHPHWVQGVAWYDGALVAHSLGNFVFDMDFMTQTQQGVVLEAVFWGGDLKGFRLVPYAMDGSFAPRPARGAVAADILGDVWRHSAGPFLSP
ncbi:CapA family protein [Nocardioides sp. LHD-245]|uniref:CapA family protein n=1 Tax=Nocardioides sp. LHD-245 TaxID=3051387 RepID=UPI0027DFC6A1|nr:CapA family protein [Nocardioides sp. LHD-245]